MSPATNDEDDPLDRAFGEYLRRSDSGEPLSREDFLAEFPPEIAAGLQELIEAADQIGQMTGFASTAAIEMPGDADTIAGAAPDGSEMSGDMAVTLPLAHRAKGDHGPTLPFDLGDYVLTEIIGRGGMGVVYKARQKELDRDVAVKMIRSGILASEDEVKRFYTEAQAAARLHHRGIVSVYQFGRRANHHFFSMEMIEGTDLQRLINGGVMDVRDAARYVRDVARAIAHAHDCGVLHRDLKPANILVDANDQVHVTDFGLAKHIDGDSSVTASGHAVGTPHYMAPEQAGGHGDRACRRSDVYALGAVLFACLTGRPPIVADTVMQTLVQVVHDPAPPVRSLRPDAPIDLQTICAKCLEKHPSRRYQSAAALADELDAFLEGRPIEARPRWAPVKAAQWFAGIPLFGALTGRKVLTSTASHRRFQAAMLCLFLLTPLVAASVLVYVRQTRDAMPARVVIAGGIDGGLYNDVATRLAESLARVHPVTTSILPTSGSLDNRRLLRSGEVQMAPVQATAVTGDDLRVVAPLFYELVHVLARRDIDMNGLADLAGRTVAVGPRGSGSAAAADLLFDSLPTDADRPLIRQGPWADLLSENQTPSPDAAILCVGRGSRLIETILGSGRWRLIGLPTAVDIALEHPSLRPMRFYPGDYPELPLPPEGIATVGTTGFLAVRSDAPAEMVTATLEVLYRWPPTPELIPRHQAAEWRGLAFHPAAGAFYRSATRPTDSRVSLWSPATEFQRGKFDASHKRQIVFNNLDASMGLLRCSLHPPANAR